MQITRLVFEEGDAKGIAYIKAIKALQQESILKNIIDIAEACAGATTALLLGLGYTKDEISGFLD